MAPFIFLANKDNEDRMDCLLILSLTCGLFFVEISRTLFDLDVSYSALYCRIITNTPI